MNAFKNFIENNLINPLWGLLIVGILLGTGYYFQENISLKPKIDANFFFSKDSRIYKQNALIDKKFIIEDSIIVSVPSKNLKDPDYLSLIKKLSDEITSYPGVTSVQSLTNGPDNLEVAINNPLWSRLLDTKSGSGSFIIVFMRPEKVQSVVSQIVKLQKRMRRYVKLSVSGIPYIIEQMRRMLTHDMKTFMSYVLLICTVLLLLIFQSFFVMLGSIVTALFAAAFTLIIQNFLKVEIGLLTANLGAIIYVLTISHIVFLASNWQNQSPKEPRTRLAATLIQTLPASFWAMFTTLCGFASLIFVNAQPLKELGYGGLTGSFVAFLSAYFVFPIFLRFSRIPKDKVMKVKKGSFRLYPFHWILACGLCLAIVGGSTALFYEGYQKLNTDPSLLMYFKKGTGIHSGVLAVDKSGGSNPLNFVISQKSKKKLKNAEAYKKLMDLQTDLEAHPSVGSVMSLPVLMQETQKHWLVSLLPWGSILNRLSEEQFGSIARGFISEDFSQALFVIRMKEKSRKYERNKIIRQLMAKPKKYDLQLDIVGGTYYLQSELAKKIRQSMQKGILALLILFSIICLLLSRSLVATFFSVLSISAIVAVVLGAVGFFKIPIDIISSPSINICLGLAVDGMIHFLMDARRSSKSGIDQTGVLEAVRKQIKPILISALIISAGFSVFYLSEFPPSQRFGLEIVFGSLVAALITTLFLVHTLFLTSKKQKVCL